jgi:hypothetical protein
MDQDQMKNYAIQGAITFLAVMLAILAAEKLA